MDQPLVGEEPQRLDDPERMPVGRLRERSPHRPRHVAAHFRRDHRLDLVLGKTLETKLLGPGLAQHLPDEPAGRRRLVETARPARRHQQPPGAIGMTGEEVEQSTRGFVGGVQVLDRDQQTSRRCRSRQELRQGIEELEARDRWIARAGPGRGIDRRLPVGHEHRELGCCRRRGTHHLGVLGVLRQGRHHLHPGPVGRGVLPVEGATDERAPTIARDARPERLDEARFPDPGVTRQQDEPAPPLERMGPRAREHRQLRATSDEGALVDRTAPYRAPIHGAR